jgi:hypothetical protein
MAQNGLASFFPQEKYIFANNSAKHSIYARTQERIWLTMERKPLSTDVIKTGERALTR